jgi:hypothetical protein
LHLEVTIELQSGLEPMRIAMNTINRSRLVAIWLACGLMAQASNASADAQLTGIAFVDSSVTSEGSKATLPADTQIHPPDSEITGTQGCPTTRYKTDGLIVAIIDYDGAPTAASLGVTRHPAAGGEFHNAPYRIDLDPGRTLQYLGPIFDNGRYELHLTWAAGQAENKVDTEFTLARSCR